MNLRFVSIKKSDPLFLEYLWGRTEKKIKIIPVQSLNVGSRDESVTFEFRPLSEIKRPSPFRLISSVVKLKSFTLILIPFLYVISVNVTNNRAVDGMSAFFALLALVFIFAGLNIRNDISDHLSGFDLVNIPFSEKPIQQGWLTASELEKISWVFFSVGISLSFPVLIRQPEEIKIVILVAALLVAGQFFKKNFYKEKQWGELILFLLIGNGIVAGYQIAMGLVLNAEIIFFGFFWGAVVLFLVYVNNFSHILTSTQAGIKNSITSLGFDKAKNFLILWWSLCLMVWFFLHLYFTKNNVTILQTILLLVASLPLIQKLSRIRSPVGSDLMQVRRMTAKTFLALNTLVVFEIFYNLGDKLNWRLP